MPLFHFVHSMDITEMRKAMDALITSEEAATTWLIRPAMKQVLLLLARAFFAKQIQGAFLLSNNGSDRLVNFIAMLLNRWVQRLFQLEHEPPLFVMGISAATPARLALGLEMRYVKSFDVVQYCLATHRFPPCSSPADLLFFDDLVHPLADETPHYCQVRAYHNQTPIYAVQAALGSLATPERVEEALSEKMTPSPPPTAAETTEDTRTMIRACLNFLAPKGGRRKRKRSSSARASRKSSIRRRISL